MRAIIVVAALLLGCGGVTPVTPPPSPNPDVKADCAVACANIGPDNLDCEEGQPTEYGVSCTEVCEGMPNTTQDYLDCVATVTDCEQVPQCPR